MGQVVLNITGEEGAAIKALVNVENATKRIDDAAKQLKAQYPDLTRVAGHSMDAIEKKSETVKVGLNAVAGAAAAIGTAIATAATLGNSHLDKVEQRTDKFMAKLEELDKALSRTGEISMLPEIEFQLGQIKSNYLDQQKINALFAQGSREAEGQLEAGDIVKAVQEAALAREGGKDESKFLSTFIKLKTAGVHDDKSGTLSDKVTELMDVFPDGMSDAGEKFLSQLMASGGADPNMALRLLQASKTSDQGEKPLLQMMQLANRDITEADLKPQKVMSEEAKAERAQLDEESLQNDKRRLEIDKELLEKPFMKKQFADERERLSVRDKEIGIRRQELEQSQVEVLTAEQQQLKRLAPIAKGGDRLKAMMQDPTLLGDEKAGFLALREQVDDEAFTTGGAFMHDVQQRTKMINESPQQKKMRAIARLKVDKANRESDASFSDLAIRQQEMEIDAEFEAAQQGKRGMTAKVMAGVSEMGVGGVNIRNTFRGIRGIGAMGNQTQSMNAEDSREVLSEIARNTRSKGNSVIHPPGGAEQNKAGGY